MKQLIVPRGEGRSYDWSQDHVFVKTPVEMTGGRATVVEDVLKPGFHLARHHHKSMVEIFYVLEGSIRFLFDDEEVTATPGMWLTIPPEVRHDVSAEEGGKLITIFTPGGFDSYLAAIAAMSKEELESEELMTKLSERYDIWPG